MAACSTSWVVVVTGEGTPVLRVAGEGEGAAVREETIAALSATAAMASAAVVTAAMAAGNMGHDRQDRTTARAFANRIALPEGHWENQARI